MVGGPGSARWNRPLGGAKLPATGSVDKSRNVTIPCSGIAGCEYRCVLVIGHRGASADAPENSVAAFRLADEQGADGVELDVRLTPGGDLLVRHDPIGHHPVRRDPVGPERVELDAAVDLATALDACGDRMLVNVEIKNLASDGGFDPTMTVVRLTIGELRRRGAKQAGRWLISSFSWATIGACREIAPDIATGYLCTSVAPSTIDRVGASGHRAVHPWERIVTEELVQQCHAAGLAVNTWTCNEPERLVELARMGVDGACTDVPGVALAALDRPNVNPRREAVSWGTRA
jgi:glycerophosphoryl diester phosphodiesterase